MRYAENITELVGNTPLVKLSHVVDGIEATVLAKLEYLNPGGSSKDRIARRIIEAAEASGQLLPGGTIVEPTSGNTGVGLALFAQTRGYRTIFVVPDKVSVEKRNVLEAYGAEVIVAPTNVPPEHPDSYYSISDRLVAEIPGAFKPNQYENPNGPASHRATTGPEIWRDTDGRITHLVAGIGTGGTISGTGAYLKEASNGTVTVVGADPEGSIYTGGPVHSYFVEGVGEDFWPSAYDTSVPDRLERVSDAESFAMTRRLAREEGLLVGGSSGMAVVAALRVARELTRDDVVVVVLPDSGRGYLDKIFNDQWMGEHGFVAASREASLGADADVLAGPGAHAGRPGPSVGAPLEERPAETGFATRAIHAGQEPDVQTGAVVPPIHLASTFAQDGVGGLRNGYEYSRSGNPTRDALQQALAALEGGMRAFSFASGLAAEDALLRALLRPGDRILMGNDAYGGTHRLIDRVLGPWGIAHTTVDTTDLGAFEAAVAQQRPALIWIETPSNPLLRITDIAAVARAAHEVDAVLVVDNTFATPYLQRPLALGADIVVHSTTKYIGGHSDVVGGAIIVGDDRFSEQIGFLHNAAGAVSAPFDAWLTLRGVKTLAVRMRQHGDNAARLAALLNASDLVEAVHYPGLASHPGHDIAARQMSGFGGMLSIQLRGGADAARRFVESTRLFTLAESLGGVESLIEYPYAMTHASVQGTSLQVPDNLVRISAGIEDVVDLAADIRSALAATARERSSVARPRA